MVTKVFNVPEHKICFKSEKLQKAIAYANLMLNDQY